MYSVWMPAASPNTCSTASSPMLQVVPPSATNTHASVTWVMRKWTPSMGKPRGRPQTLEVLEAWKNQPHGSREENSSRSTATGCCNWTPLYKGGGGVGGGGGRGVVVVLVVVVVVFAWGAVLVVVVLYLPCPQVDRGIRTCSGMFAGQSASFNP